MADQIFTKEMILKKSIKLAKKNGLKDLSMRKLAKELKSSVMPIYGRFLNKEELLDQIFITLLKEIAGDSTTTFEERYVQLMKFGLKYPLLYKDMKDFAAKSFYYTDLFEEVLNLMRADIRLRNCSTNELLKISKVINWYISGVIENNKSYSYYKKANFRDNVDLLYFLINSLILATNKQKK